MLCSAHPFAGPKEGRTNKILQKQSTNAVFKNSVFLFFLIFRKKKKLEKILIQRKTSHIKFPKTGEHKIGVWESRNKIPKHFSICSFLNFHLQNSCFKAVFPSRFHNNEAAKIDIRKSKSFFALFPSALKHDKADDLVLCWMYVNKENMNKHLFFP